MLNHISDEAIQPIDISKTLGENMVLLNNAHGYGRLKPIIQQQKIFDIIDFPIAKDPTTIFLWLEKEIAILEACGGKSDELFLRRAILTGLETTLQSNSVFESNDFWFNVRGAINLIKKFSYEEVKTLICDYWEAHRNRRMAVNRDPFDPTKKVAVSYQATGSGFKSNKKCDFCFKYRKRLAKSHKSGDCYYGDKEGWTKVNQTDQTNFAQGDNKDDSSSYSGLCLNVSAPIVYDTGCTPLSYFKDKPSNLKPYTGSIKSASNHLVQAKGIGHFKLGDTIIDSFIKRNLDANQISYENDDIQCSACIEGKLTKSPKQNKAQDLKSYEVLEMIEADSTVFPIDSYDGFHANVKFIDRSTGYIFGGWLSNQCIRTIQKI